VLIVQNENSKLEEAARAVEKIFNMVGEE